MRIRALVADDERPARRRLLDLLACVPEVEVVAEARSGREAIQAIREAKPDLVFLDVQMPDRDGFGVVESVGVERMPITIFVTAYDRYALKAFEVHALDYLLKPFSDERFEDSLRRALVQLRSRGRSALEERLESFLRSYRADSGDGESDRLERIVLKSAGRVTFLSADEIHWIEAAGVYVHLHTARASHLHRDQIGRLALRLDSRKFVRIHRSTIVNLEEVRELRADAHGEYDVMMKDGTRLRLSRSYRAELQRSLGQSL